MPLMAMVQFLSLAGRTSCPYERGRRIFYNSKMMQHRMILLVTRWRIQEGTIKFCYPKVEVPVLRVTVASVSNVSALEMQSSKY
jgi:hypothetical protein